ncbi:acyl-CoA thioesterase [Rhodococcus sp. NPDC127530]|uniref:acyl-CoA thioesterase n=1 Tax=unclassified Rhodococcus (in: high G+C Gram-positive bacteria) TaxID=192944 RepID=UPI00364431AA
MPQSVTEIVDLLDLDTIGPNTFRGRPARSTELVKVYGGQVVAQSLMAAGRTVSGGRKVHSLHAHFLLGGDTQIPIVYEVENLRDGGSFSSRRVTARQHGDLIFHATTSFHKEEPGFEHRPSCPVAPSYDDAPPLADVMETTDVHTAAFWRREWEALDIRYASDTRPQEQRAETPGLQHVWIRASGPLPTDPFLHTCVLAYVSDLGLLSASLVPHGFLVWAPGVPRASLDHSMWFHDSVQADQWMRFDQSSAWAGGARGLSNGKVFDTHGRLLASVAQEGLIRPHGAVRARLDGDGSALRIHAR